MPTPATMTHSSPRRALLADLLLFSVAVVWGFNFTVIKDAIGRIDPMLYIMLRYFVALAIFMIVMPKALTGARRSDWRRGAVLGAFYLTALIVQTIGLQHTTPGKSSFITGLNVAMVPFLFWIVSRKSPGWIQIVGAAVAAIGLGVLSLRGNFTLGWGDSLALLGALFYALHIMATGFYAPKMDAARLAILQIAAAAVLCAVITPFATHITFSLPWQAWAAVVWTALGGTIYAFFIQSWAQRYTSSTHTAVLLCLESVFGAFFGVLFGLDSVTWRLLGGAGLIFGGILIIEVVPALLRGRAAPITPGDDVMEIPGDEGASQRPPAG